MPPTAFPSVVRRAERLMAQAVLTARPGRLTTGPGPVPGTTWA